MKKNLLVAVLLVAGIMLFIGVATYIAIDGFGTQQGIKEVAQENRDLTCAISRLISFVPAIQFEGESLDNFKGWVEARRDMLEAAKERGQCPEETIELLEQRVRTDDELLKELENADR